MAAFPRVLVAEARPERRAAIAQALDHRVDVVHARHGPDALTRLRSGSFDVAVLAADLPLASGAEIAAIVAEEGVAARVVLVGEQGPELVVGGRLDNVVATLARPLSVSDVQRAVRRCLDAAAPITTLPPDRSGPVERAARVLVVDDDPDVREGLELALGGAFDVCAVPDGPEAVRLARTQRFDLVLVDLAMPLLDGEWTAVRLREAVGNPKILLMSGGGDVVSVARRIGAGVVRKPFDEDGLRERLRRAVATR